MVIQPQEDKITQLKFGIQKKKVQYIFTLKGHTSIIWEIRELEGNKLISASDDNKSKVWDLKEKKRIIVYF